MTANASTSNATGSGSSATRSQSGSSDGEEDGEGEDNVEPTVPKPRHGVGTVVTEGWGSWGAR